MSTGRDKERNSFLVDGLKTERMKTYSIEISPTDKRVKAIYEAPADTQNGQECLKTLYVYIGTSSAVLLSKEIAAKWDSAFDDEAIAKATADSYTATELEELGY